MKYAALVIPVLFLALFVYAAVRRVKLYDCFTDGVKGAIPLVLSLFPYLAAVLMLSELFEGSGLSALLTEAISPALRAVGVPPEIAKLLLVKPFSGSGSTALLSEIFSVHGADSYIGRCAAVCYGSSETVFYISAVYFAGIRRKTPAKAIAVSLLANLLGAVFGCLFCRFL